MTRGPTTRWSLRGWRILALAVGYYVAAEAGLALGALDGNVAPVWPPTGVAIGVLVVFGERLWPGVTIGALAVNGFSDVPAMAAVAMAVGNTLEAVVAVRFVSRLSNGHPLLQRVSGVAGFAALAAGVSTMVSATIGTASLWATGVTPATEVFVTWRTWWIGDALGALIVGSLIMVWLRPGYELHGGRSGWELVGVLALTGVMAEFVFTTTAGYHYLLFPLLATIAFRYGARGVTAGAVLVWAVTVIRTSSGFGPFAGGIRTDSLGLLDLFLAVMALTGLILAAVISERDRGQRALARANRDLDDRVAWRTDELARERHALMEAQRIAHIGSWSWEVEPDEVIWSDELYRLFGLEPGSIRVDFGVFLAYVHPDDRHMVQTAVQAAMQTGASFAFDHRVVHPSGEERWIHGEGQVVTDDDGAPISMSGTAQDITARRNADFRFQSLMEGAPDAMVVVDNGGAIQVVNRQTEVLFGYARSELLGKQLEVLIPESRRARHPKLRDSYFDDPQTRPMGAGIELAASRKDGSEFPVDISLSPMRSDNGMFVCAAIRDITDRKRAEEIVAHQATHDDLTGLPNRTLLADRLEQALVRSARQPTTVAVLFLDLDRLKVINDSRGHSAGDRLLQAVARRLEETVRVEDTLARFGGDEFVIVTEGIGEDYTPTMLAARIADALSEPVRLDDADVTVSVSIGVAIAAPGDESESLLRDADAAMYQAKDQGRDRWVVFDAAMRAAATERLEIEHGLRRAIEEEQFEVHYQPIFGLTTETVVGVEALVRWQHPERGLVFPGEFIPIAEETGLIVGLGELVLRTACNDVAAWHRSQPSTAGVSVSVNLSARQLLRPEVADSVRNALVESGLEPSRLYLEITESVLLDDAVEAARALESLKALGVRISVDDFGTGYSSLTYLKQFPVDTLKIDRSFIADLAHVDSHRRDRAIVASVVDLAHAFGLTTVAEGVETAEQLEGLRALGCERGQGYFWSRPVPEPQALAWIVEHVDPAVHGTVTRQPGEPLRVLLVEDEEPLRHLMRMIVDDSSNFRVVAEAGDGREAIAMARHHQPDIVIMDLAMPGIGGLEALPLIQAVDPEAKVVVFSGLDSAAVEDDARHLGAVGYFSKGCDPMEFITYLDDLFAAAG